MSASRDWGAIFLLYLEEIPLSIFLLLFLTMLVVIMDFFIRNKSVPYSKGSCLVQRVATTRLKG